VKLTRHQRALLERMAEGRVLFVRLERGDAGTRETCWIDTVQFEPMTVNALITAGLVEQQDDVRRNAGAQTLSYHVSSSGLAALRSF
jgi:hypothetical protein